MCEKCREKNRVKDAELRNKRNILHEAIEKNKESTIQICLNCGKDFAKFNTIFNKTSKICQKCKENDKKQDHLRSDRVRNYMKEHHKNIENFFKNYIEDASKRNYSFNLQYDEFKHLTLSSCYYCDYKKDGEVNGIDRVDNAKGYETSNCVTCCKICNRMKNYLHPLYFIELCKLYSSLKKQRSDFYSTWKEYYGRSCYHIFSSYKKHSEEVRGIKVKIKQEDWDVITRSPCYLCGYQDAKGIGLDRVDNTIREYTKDNIKPCCGTCNNVKGYFTLEQIKEKAIKIANKWTDTILFESIPRGVNPMKNGKTAFKKERIVWKPLGVYYDILGNENRFYEQHSTSLTDEDYEQLYSIVFSQEKEEALKYIKEILDSLKTQ